MNDLGDEKRPPRLRLSNDCVDAGFRHAGIVLKGERTDLATITGVFILISYKANKACDSACIATPKRSYLLVLSC